MARFTARPIVVEGHQWAGNTVGWPEAFARSVQRHLPNGTVEVATGSGPRPCKNSDWIVRGPNGLFSVLSDAELESSFDEIHPLPEVLVKRAYVKRAGTHG